jgi:hypothetical protein
MRTYLLSLLVAVASGSAVLADSTGRGKFDFTTPPDRLPPPKSATGNSCAAFGPGFVKVAGTDTCVKIGGSVQIDGGGAVAPR